MSEKDRREEKEMVRPQKGGQSQKNLLVALRDCTREGNAGKENILCYGEPDSVRLHCSREETGAQLHLEVDSIICRKMPNLAFPLL